MTQPAKSPEKDRSTAEGAGSSAMSRRGFLGRSSLGAVAAAVAPATVALAVTDPAVAQAFKGLGEVVGSTLLRMARDIYPHDRLPDNPYLEVLQQYDAKAATDPKLRDLIVQSVSALEAVSIKRYSKRYSEVPSEAHRVDLLYAIEQTDFFQMVRTDLVSQLYNNKSVWPAFGYEGSSWQKGGYINRGFNDIDWL